MNLSATLIFPQKSWKCYKMLTQTIQGLINHFQRVPEVVVCTSILPRHYLFHCGINVTCTAVYTTIFINPFVNQVICTNHKLKFENISS